MPTQGSQSKQGTPVQPKPAPAPMQAKHEKIQPKLQKFDAFRPLRLTWAFVAGTLNGAVNGMAYLGKKGMWFGAGIGLLSAMAYGGVIGSVFLGGVVGLAGAAVLGGAIGAVIGGPRNVSRARRKEKYADDLAQRQMARAQRPAQGVGPGVDYDDLSEARRKAAAYNFERSQQQERENERDYDRYWQGREERRADHGVWGR